MSICPHKLVTRQVIKQGSAAAAATTPANCNLALTAENIPTRNIREEHSLQLDYINKQNATQNQFIIVHQYINSLRINY